MLALKSQLIGTALVLAFCAEKTYADNGSLICEGDCQLYAQLVPQNTDYRNRCEAETGPKGADPKWPCFTMWSGRMAHVIANTTASGKAPRDFFLVKDDTYKGKHQVHGLSPKFDPRY